MIFHQHEFFCLYVKYSVSFRQTLHKYKYVFINSMSSLIKYYSEELFYKKHEKENLLIVMLTLAAPSYKSMSSVRMCEIPQIIFPIFALNS